MMSHSDAGSHYCRWDVSKHIIKRMINTLYASNVMWVTVNVGGYIYRATYVSVKRLDNSYESGVCVWRMSNKRRSPAKWSIVYYDTVVHN